MLRQEIEQINAIQNLLDNLQSEIFQKCSTEFINGSVFEDDQGTMEFVYLRIIRASAELAEAITLLEDEDSKD